MNRDRRILEMLEACRAGSDDRSAPGFEELADALGEDVTLQAAYQNARRFDEAVLARVEDIEVPSGLQDRLIGAVDASGGGASVLAEPCERAPISRRRWIAGGLAVAASLAIAAGVAFTRMGGETWDAARIEREALDWRELLTGTEWRTDAPPAEFATPRGIRLNAHRWRQLRDPSPGLGKVVAFDLTGAQTGGVAPDCVLFIVRADVPSLPATPPMDPTITQGRLLATWRSGDRVCVLLVRGADPGTLRAHYDRWFTSAVGAA